MKMARDIPIHDIILVARWLARAASVAVIILVVRGFFDIVGDLGGNDQLQALITFIVAGLLFYAGYLLEFAPPAKTQSDPEIRES